MMRKLEQITPSIYIFPRDETPNTVQPNIGVIALKHETVLIDAGNSPRHARQIMTAANARGLAPISTIILTHHHWDHTFASASYENVRIITHDLCASYMEQQAERDWNAAMLRDEIAENPKREISNNAMIDAISDWREFRIATPTMTFSNTLSLYVEDTQIELEHVGGQHADDSVVVKLPDAGVIFLGDSYYPEPYKEDLALPMLQNFLDLDCNIYIDGHGAPRTHAEFAKMIAWEKGRQGMTS